MFFKVTQHSKKRAHGLVVMTSRLHREDPRFESEWAHSKNLNIFSANVRFWNPQIYMK